MANPSSWSRRPTRLLVLLLVLASILTIVPVQAAPASPTPTPSASPAPPTGAVTTRGNLRRAPGLGGVVLGQLCPGDTVAFVGQQVVDREPWYHVRVVIAVADCAPTHVTVGTAGWASRILVAAPPGDVPVEAVPIPPTATARPRPTARPKPTVVTAPATGGGRRIGAMCRDGTRSRATGRGACSHHGGVAQWLYGP